MNIAILEEAMYQLSDLFLAPVLILLVVLFAYSLFALGAFAVESLQRRSHRSAFRAALRDGADTLPQEAEKAYPLMALLSKRPEASRDELDVTAFELLEGVRTVSRIAPMLGLIATMVPMGPALKALANGNVQGISENLVIAFSAVIFGLVIASITFWIASVRKRWLASELVAVTPLIARDFDASMEVSREAA
jgi:biopolymer transport protein ExbB/TolQ